MNKQSAGARNRGKYRPGYTDKAGLDFTQMGENIHGQMRWPKNLLLLRITAAVNDAPWVTWWLPTKGNIRDKHGTIIDFSDLRPDEIDQLEKFFQSTIQLARVASEIKEQRTEEARASGNMRFNRLYRSPAIMVLLEWVLGSHREGLLQRYPPIPAMERNSDSGEQLGPDEQELAELDARYGESSDDDSPGREHSSNGKADGSQ